MKICRSLLFIFIIKTKAKLLRLRHRWCFLQRNGEFVSVKGQAHPIPHIHFEAHKPIEVHFFSWKFLTKRFQRISHPCGRKLPKIAAQLMAPASKGSLDLIFKLAFPFVEQTVGDAKFPFDFHCTFTAWFSPSVLLLFEFCRIGSFFGCRVLRKKCSYDFTFTFLGEGQWCTCLY